MFESSSFFVFFNKINLAIVLRCKEHCLKVLIILCTLLYGLVSHATVEVKITDDFSDLNLNNVVEWTSEKTKGKMKL